VRVAGTGIAAHYYGVAAATGFFHECSVWLMFIAAFGLLFVFVRLMLMIVRAGAREQVGVANVA